MYQRDADGAARNISEGSGDTSSFLFGAAQAGSENLPLFCFGQPILKAPRQGRERTTNDWKRKKLVSIWFFVIGMKSKPLTPKWHIG